MPAQNTPANRREVWTEHPQMQHVQSCTQHNHISSREHAWLKLQGSSIAHHLCVPKIFCHPRVMSHLPLFASSPTFPLTSQTPTTLLGARRTFWDPMTITLRRSPTEWRFHADTHSYRLWAQNQRDQCHRPPKRSVLKTWSPEELSLKEILGTDPYHLQERFMRSSLTEDMDEFGKLVQSRPISSQRCVPITTQRRALKFRILKMENFEKCCRHHCFCKIEKTVNPLECQSHR